MPKARPFSEIVDGVPSWTLELEDPQDALEHRAELHLRRIQLPGGAVLALCLRLFDVAKRPQLFHLAGPLGHPEVRAWADALAGAGSVRLDLRRSGWMSSFERRVGVLPAEIATLGAPDAGQDPEGAIRSYLDAYKLGLPRLHQPEAVWDAMQAKPLTPAKKPSRAPVLLIVVVLLLALAILVASQLGWVPGLPKFF